MDTDTTKEEGVAESCDLSCDLEEGVSSMNVSDISSDLTSRATPPAVGPQTPPPLSHETTPTSNSAGVSDISSDAMDVSSPAHSADVSTLEGRGTGEDESVQVDSTASEPPKVILTSDPIAGGVAEEVRMGRPPPLDSLSASLTQAPPSPLSTQNTPSRIPGKRKVSIVYAII